MYTITSDTGALPTTNMGTVVSHYKPNFDSRFAFKVIELLNNPDLPKLQAEVKEKAYERFSVENIIEQWNKKVFQ